MYIKKYEQFKFNNYYYPFNSISSNINYLTRFLREGFPRMYNSGIKNYMEKLETIYKDGMSFESVTLNIDIEKKIIYLSEPYFEYQERATTNEIEELMDKAPTLELCHRKLINYIIITKDNFIHLLLIWEKLINQSSLFVLLYQDDKDWYDLLPFDSKEAMEKFIADHTNPEAI